MVGAGETYLAAYALALGMGELAAGLIATIPMVAGALMQLVSPWGVRWLGSRRRWVVLGASAQAASLAALPIAAVWDQGRAAVVFLAASFYWGAGMSTGPVWNTWVEEIIPRQVRTRFFAHRARIGQACVLLGFILGALALQTGRQADLIGGGRTSWLLVTFCGLFSVAALCRFASAGCLASQSEPTEGRFKDELIGLREWTGRLRGDAGARLLVYLLAVQVAVQISGPFFTPFMLSDSELGLSYLHYMLLVSIGFLGKVVSLPLWGLVAHRIGARRLLWIGGLGIIPVAGLWVVSQHFLFLAGIQAVSGLVWAAYELALLLMFFESIPKHERTSVLTYYNLGNALAMVTGGLAGGCLLKLLGEGHTAYLTLFACSTLARLSTVLLLVRVPDFRPRVVVPAVRTIAMRPDDSTMDPPILPSLPDLGNGHGTGNGKSQGPCITSSNGHDPAHTGKAA
jgi:MFS family permease